MARKKPSDLAEDDLGVVRAPLTSFLSASRSSSERSVAGFEIEFREKRSPELEIDSEKRFDPSDEQCDKASRCSSRDFVPVYLQHSSLKPN